MPSFFQSLTKFSWIDLLNTNESGYGAWFSIYLKSRGDIPSSGTTLFQAQEGINIWPNSVVMNIDEYLSMFRIVYRTRVTIENWFCNIFALLWSSNFMDLLSSAFNNGCKTPAIKFHSDKSFCCSCSVVCDNLLEGYEEFLDA